MLTPGQSNVLVDVGGRARIMGFRIAAIITEVDPGQTAFNQDAEIEHWSAPEVLKSGVISGKADIFSFAMIMIEVRHKQSTTRWVWFTNASHGHRYLPKPIASITFT